LVRGVEQHLMAVFLRGREPEVGALLIGYLQDAVDHFLSDLVTVAEAEEQSK
jgi:hypothetical protein